jgi:hypothetical protein
MTAVTTALLLVFGCSDPNAPTRSTLDQLVSQRATEQQIAETLHVSGLTRYTPGSEQWESLVTFLGGEAFRRGDTPKGYEPIARAVRKQRGILFYTTDYTQVWLILYRP